MTALMESAMESARDWTARFGEELMQEESRWQQGERLQRKVLRSLVWNADVIAAITLGAWGWVHELLENKGFEGGELASKCQVLLKGIDLSLAGHDRLLALAKASGLTSEAAGFHELEAKLPALREARPMVAEALALASRPPRPIDVVMLTASRAALDRGEFVVLDDDYLARVQAGENL